MDQASTPDYEFRGYRLDTTSQVLTSPAGRPIALPSRAFLALRFLVERSGELVEKETLFKAVWPNSIVEENNLSQCILALRKALGENAGERRFILTVPGRGFKFVAPVTVLQRSCPGPTLPALSAAVPPLPNLIRWRKILGLGVTAIAAVTGLLWALAPQRPITSAADFLPLTDVADAATAPALSPDGRLLAFIRGGGQDFATSGQIWLKVLPEGEPVQLTHLAQPLYAPAFTPDLTRIAFSVIEAGPQGLSWNTYTVPITGGEPRLLLPNASGLSFIGAREVMYSEFKTGTHLGIVVSQQDRSQHRDIYFPGHMRGMAHFSYLSPDRRNVLIAEMEGSAEFGQCRLVPFDGSSAGRVVGPNGSCRYAAWSPDGAWMYFSAIVEGHSHLWRQRFGSTRVDQITFGPTDESGVTVTADGRALLTSLGLGQSTIWLHDRSGDRAVTSESSAWAPWLSDDARRVYFLSARSPKSSATLWRMDLVSGVREPILTGYEIKGYDISYDEQQVVFTKGREGAAEIWVAPLDHHSAPRLLRRGGDEAAFDSKARVYFRSLGEHANFLHRMNATGNAEEQLLSAAIIEFHGVAPAGDRVAVDLPLPTGNAVAMLVPLDGGTPWKIANGWAPSHWSRDGKQWYVELSSLALAEDARTGRTARLSVGSDGMPATSVTEPIPNSAIIPHNEDLLAVGSDPSVYVYVQSAQRRNVYQIPLH